MTIYKDRQILVFLVGLLNESISHVGYPPYDYKVYLDMKPEEALEQLSFRLRRIRDIREGSKKDYSFYFSTESEYIKFLVESSLAECLNVWFVLKKKKAPMPPLNDRTGLYANDQKFHFKRTYRMTPFKNWLKACQGKKAEPTRMVAT